MKRVEYIRDKLQEYRSVVLDVITASCHAALYQQGFTYDDRNVPPFQIIRGKPTGGMSYTEKANKRKYCERLAWYVFKRFLVFIRYTQPVVIVPTTLAGHKPGKQGLSPLPGLKEQNRGSEAPLRHNTRVRRQALGPYLRGDLFPHGEVHDS